MKRTVLFVQGGGEGTHDHWDDALVASLRRELGPSHPIRYPRMPDEGDPHYAPWRGKIATELARLDDGAVLVGHSIGGTMLIHALAETETAPPRAIGGIFLVAAPFVGAGGWSSEEIAPKPDLATRLPRDVPIFLYHGTKDATAPVEHVRLYAGAIPSAVVRLLEGRDHQLDGDLSEVAADIRRLDGT